jgi:hypothetical protein
VLKLLYRTGFPEQYKGHKLHIFEIILNDGTTRLAVIYQKTPPEGEGLSWRNSVTGVEIPTDTVLGWRETYNCDDARRDIDAYFQNPISIVNKSRRSDALTRHIDREPCLSCRKYFEEKSDRHVFSVTG